MSEEEKIGYGKPPKRTQFKKGKSGNPKGRPRAEKSANEQQGIMEQLSKTIAVTENGKPIKITYLQAVHRRLATDAANGKPAAIRMVMEYTKGGPPITAADLEAAKKQGGRELMQEILRDINGRSTGLPRLQPGNSAFKHWDESEGGVVEEKPE